WGYKDELITVSTTGSATTDEGIEELDHDDREEMIESVQSGDSVEQERITEYRRQAQLLIKGLQHREASPAYLIDCLRLALGKQPVYGSAPGPEDQDRIHRISAALAAKRLRQEGVVTQKPFRDALRDHAAGFLAPLIREMSVTCESATLPHGVVLVDLPGTGVAGDIHGKITNRWIREQAEAMVLVVNHRGLQEADARLLHQSDHQLDTEARCPSP
ncbi:MAG: hypothetical protein ACP5XB_19505, partial [Isosphaeraceae bacterium]